MGSCPKCGAPTKRDDLFCRSCGTSLKTETSEPPRERYTRPRDECFESERRTDYTGLISFGIFLLILGAIFIANPNLISHIDVWIKDMTTPQQHWVRPPVELINTAALFFGLVGVSNIVMAGVRSAVYKRTRRIFGDILSGAALLVFSYLLYLYGKETLRGRMVIGVEVLVIGLLVIVYAAARFSLMRETSEAR